MIKAHQKIAVIFLKAIKDNGGLLTNIQFQEKGLMKLFDFSSDIIVIDGLAELGLIDLKRQSVYRLTDKGWKFKSFRQLRFNQIIDKIKDNISFVLNVFFMCTTIYLTILNINLSTKDKVDTEELIKLKSELRQLDERLNALHFEHEKLLQ